MRWRGLIEIIAAFAASATVAASAPPLLTPPPPDFAPGFASEAHTGLTAAKKARVDVWRLRRTTSRGGDFDLVLALAPRRAARVSFVAVERRAPARPLYGAVPCPGAMAMINGSFFVGVGKGERVLGLLRLNGKTLQGPSGRPQGGFLTTDGSSLSVLPRGQAADAERADNAIESSPILALGGANGMRGDDGVRTDRVAAGVTASGDVLLIGAFGARADAVSLYEFESLAEAALAANKQSLGDLIALDGGPSAHVYLPRSDLFYGQTGSIFLTDAICLGVN